MSMRQSGIHTCHIFNHLAQERGGHEYVAFLKKDLYNWIGRQRLVEDEEKTNAEGALGYLGCLGRPDADFFETHSIDVENRLAELFCHRDYACFGDIMAFDTTYKKNSYNKPLLIFVGLNHHYMTIVFVVALLYNETKETYILGLEEFLECMKTNHLLWWSSMNNITINVPHPVFKSKFNELLYQYCTEEEFEDTWKSMVSEFEFEDSRWATTTYNNRRSWAECFQRGH
ncbi:protein FAR1-RELATED SEQUENCE 5-like [Humulus lupulus]|uniref:protein FAR1-RELATED SEQUENCE 5-like n=1 Tax=Humulus lupulus TaxID=3486 RepID=UPI002B405CB6|nr:protein FAR1-RELATED SEQUENCE 5-like [Humulus lupulus]